MKRLVVEGWRSSSHSYALVNQHQLLQLIRDPRFSVYHEDVPFFQARWSGVDAGFGEEASALLRGLRPPPSPRVDVIYRISWPLRVHGGQADRVFVFGTCEYGQYPPNSICGPDGTEGGVDFRAVDIVTPSRWSRRNFLRLGFSEQQVHVIPHGVDPAMFEPLALRAQPAAYGRRATRAALQIPDDAFVFLNIGSTTWNKGIGPLLAAFARHRLRNDNAILVLKGGDALYGALVSASVQEAQKLCADLSDPRVKASLRYLPDNLSQAGMAALYAASDAYVSPYRAEGFNLPVLEALASGLPAIVTAGGATDDFCGADHCLKVEATPARSADGDYLEPNLESIVHSMQTLTDGAAAYRAAASQGRQDIIERYSWRSVTRQLGDLLSG